MPSLKITDALLALETRKALSLPMAALILGAVSQVEALVELAERVCNGGSAKTIGETSTD